MGKPACCCYDNVGYNCEKFGRLYNWFAVVDKRGLAPKGYHIPSNEEWSSLLDYLGPRAFEILKSEVDWDGKNEVSFNSLPGGSRSSNGRFSYLGSIGVWWSSSEIPYNYAWGLYLGNYFGIYNKDHHSKGDGLSVRCQRDY